MTRHLILIGLPGAGKTTVGARSAALLGARFTDLDLVIESRARRPIPEIFAVEGEPAFRRLERTAMDQVLSQKPQVIAPGGGWAAEPGNLEAAEERAFAIYLAISPERAAARLATSYARPLLAGADRVAKLERLLEQREAYYRRAGMEIDASIGSPDLVAEAVVAIARRYAGW